MNRKALITIRTSKDGKYCSDKCPGMNDSANGCTLFGVEGLDWRFKDNACRRSANVRCRACVMAEGKLRRMQRRHANDTIDFEEEWLGNNT